ncbi:MAG TPA: gamma-glutamyl-phosphate reductase, partial [Candidatus Binatia bacterium]|nr:gamma-glutamyl-phosphate reductase [Candidatus Binatia bacterium]
MGSTFKEEAVELGKRAKAAARRLARLSSGEKNRALRLMADGLESQATALLEANRRDLDAAGAAG